MDGNSKDINISDDKKNAQLRDKLLSVQNKLVIQQQQIKEKKLPVIILFEGWGASGKGTVIQKIMQTLDPRFFNVVPMEYNKPDDEKYPFLWKYFTKIPENGTFLILDEGWMSEITHKTLDKKLNKKAYKHAISEINEFERTLNDNGYLILKFFLNITEKEQKKRLNVLKSNSDTKWRVSEYDKYENHHFDKCSKLYEQFRIDNSSDFSPWHVINSKYRKNAELEIMSIISENIEKVIINGTTSQAVCRKKAFPLISMPLLSDIDLNQSVSDEEYALKYNILKQKLNTLHNQIYKAGIPVIIGYEGWDAAGKGGNIKRLSAGLDPRGYEVHPISSPLPNEKNRHFLWRFWTKLPENGNIAIFDRTWYGRVMVERIEGFCSETDWKRAYTEINEFEKQLHDWGAVIIKFWIQIDKETQLKRFTERQNTPQKQWKITDEDWRNREKWDKYDIAVNEMLSKTSTEYAPWNIIESTDKKYARLKTMQILVDELTKALEQHKK